MAAAHAKFDAYAHHPYPLRPGETPSSGGCKNCPSITMATIFRSAIPFIGLQILGLALCIIFPDIILWLPKQLYAGHG